MLPMTKPMIALFLATLLLSACGNKPTQLTLPEEPASENSPAN